MLLGVSPGTRSRRLSDRKRLVSSPSIALPQDAACSCIGMPGRRSQIVTSSKNSPLCARQQRCLIFQARAAAEADAIRTAVGNSGHCSGKLGPEGACTANQAHEEVPNVQTVQR